MATLKQTVNLPGAYDLEPGGLRATWDKIYLGLIRDVNDARHMGRIRVWIPELGGAINNEATWIICDYASPFAGASNVADVNLNPTSSQTDYGMTFIPPDLNNQVLVCFINGDPSRGVWFGCLFQVDRNHMTPSTPGSSPSKENKNILTGGQPIFKDSYDFAKEAGVPELPIEQGGPAPRGMQQGIRTMGIRTPYGHTFVMDDTPEDAFIRLQTRGLAQIVIHDTKDRIIINTGPNRARIEMDKEGNIDIFGQKSVSVSAGQDINLHADRDVNIEAGGSIKMRSLDETRMFSKKPFNISSGGDVLLFSQGNMHLVSNSNIYNTAVGSLQYRSNYGIFLTTQENNIDFKSVSGNIRMFAGQNIDASSFGDMRLRSITGVFNLVASSDVKIEGNGTLNFIGGADVKLQANGSLNLRSGANSSVKTGPNTVLNVANLPNADKPAVPDIPETSVPGVVALSPDIRTEERVQLQNVVSPARSIQIVQTIVSRLPGADPWRQRSVAGPGYSNTGLVQRKTTPPESTYKIGQVSPAQDKPLQVYGIVNGQTGLHIGQSWDEGRAPQYEFKQLGPRVLLPSTEWTVNNRGIQIIIDHEGLGGNLIGKPFDDACKSGQKLLGYGHLLTSEELQNNTVTLNATDDSGTQIATQLNVGEGISETNMKVLLKTDIKKIEGKIHSSIGSNLLTQDQFNSLADFIYNIGSDNFDKSGITGMISTGDYNKVPNEMIRWILACNNEEKIELKTRRLNNAFLFSGQARPDADFSATASGAGKGFDGNQAKKAWCYLRGKGYQPEHIAGLLGNFTIESGLNPRVDSNPTFKGIAQWNSDRFKNMPQAIGVSWPQLSQLSNDTALYKSLDFVDWEFKNTHRNAYSKMLATNSPESAARAVNEYYEISSSGLLGRQGTITPEAQNRFNTAKTIFDQLNGTQCG